MRAFDEARLFELVEPVGHRARADHGGGEQVARRKPVGRTGAAQGRQHVEARGVQPVRRQRLLGFPGKMGAQPREAAEQAHRLDIEVRPFAVPLGENSVDVIHDTT
ncbi:hypothetical protein D9M70_609800 [compost metagenome]